MSAPLLVVTPSPAFGELIRRSLEESESYRVFVVSNKATAIVRADEELCHLALLDYDMGEEWVDEVGRALRTVIPNIRLFIVAEEETLPAFESLLPWTQIAKPIHMPDLVKLLSRPTGPLGKGAREHAAAILPWLDDVNKAAQHLTRLTLESSAQAALITREGEVWAYAGQLSQAAAQEVAATMARHWDQEMEGDLLRFARFESTKAEHVLYATRIAKDMLMGMVFDAETPFSTIRSQAAQLGNSFSDNGTATSAVVERPLTETPPTPTPAPAAQTPGAPTPQVEFPSSSFRWPRPAPPETPTPLPSEVQEEDEEEIPVPPISEILTDIPSPDPEPMTTLDRADTAEPLPSAESDETQPGPFTTDFPLPRPTTPVTPSSMAETVASRPVPRREPVEKLPPSQVETPSRPETPVRPPLPGELSATLPHSMVGFSRTGGEGEPIVLEPVSAGLYHLTYACLLVPRFGAHFLTGDVADKLSEWMPIICVAFGWRLEYLAVRPEYLQWVVNVPPATSPGYVMRVMRQQISDKIFTAFPRLKRDNPSGDFWAPGYLIMGGTQPHPSQLVKDYIRQVRQRQGIDKPKK
jgi:REP element-mobilizing transposase RayT/CheY-like chemotaxis protein